jgi:K+-transporting ATPase c subunit
MTQDLLRQIRPALVVFVLLSVVTGIAYPLAVTGISLAVFPSAAEEVSSSGTARSSAAG